jgi:hypothetical protein
MAVVTLGCSWSTRDTVIVDTPARRATSAITDERRGVDIGTASWSSMAGSRP